MCGIFGVLNREEKLPDQAVLESAIKSMAHRGPDNFGFYNDGTAYLAHSRLKIIDLTSAGNQPIANEDGTAFLIFNGEIYNYRELRSMLKKKGHRFRGDSDSEVIIHLYEDLGEKCVNRLRGMFAFAVWDKKKNRIFAARDHLGIKPLYFFENNNSFFFSSEIKAFRYLNEIPFTLDKQAVYHYLTIGSIPPPLTIIKGVRSLLPGHFLTRDKTTAVEKYWQTDFPDAPKKMTLAEGAVSLRTLLEDSVRSHMVSDVPVGAFLSGGLDSTIIVALMSKFSSQPVRTFTVGYDVKGEFDETGYARLTADRYSTDHSEYIITEKDLVNNIFKAIWSMDQPSHDALNSYFVSMAAKQAGLKVAFSGLGADELYAGYSSFKFAKKIKDLDWFIRRVPSLVTRSWKRLDKIISADFRNSWKWKAMSALLGCYPRISQQYHQAKLFFDEGEKESIFREDYWAELGQESRDRDSFALLDDMAGKAGTEDIVNRVSCLELNSYLSSTLLRDTDAMSMAHSLEIRVPFLDRRLVEYSLTMPGDLKLHRSGSKYALINSVRDIVPEEIINRKKMGFAFPLGVWLKRPAMMEVVNDCLSREAVAKRGIFDFGTVDRYRREFFRNNNLRNGQLYLKIWLMTVLELWSRAYLDEKDNFGL